MKRQGNEKWESFVCSEIDLILQLVSQSPPVACVTYITYCGSNQAFDCRHDKDEDRRGVERQRSLKSMHHRMYREVHLNLKLVQLCCEGDVCYVLKCVMFGLSNILRINNITLFVICNSVNRQNFYVSRDISNCSKCKKTSWIGPSFVGCSTNKNIRFKASWFPNNVTHVCWHMEKFWKFSMGKLKQSEMCLFALISGRKR